MNERENDPQHPFADTALARFLTQHFEALDNRARLQSIAASLGYAEPNLLKMMASGAARVPLAKVVPLAAALGMNPAFLLGLGAADYWPQTAEAAAWIARGTSTPSEANKPGAREAPGVADETGSSEKPPIDLPPPVSDDDSTYLNLNFKVSPAFHHRFRLEAAYRRITMKELVELSFESLLRNVKAAPNS